MPTMQPITIQRGSFVCNIYDVGNLMRLPLANVRKLWKIMFSAEDENRETIQTIRDWLPAFTAECAERIPQAEVELAAAKATAARKHSESAAMGDGYWSKRVTALKAALKRAANKDNEANLTRALESAIVQRDAPKLADQAVRAAQGRVTAAKAAHVKAQKLQTIFNEFTTK